MAKQKRSKTRRPNGALVQHLIDRILVWSRADLAGKMGVDPRTVDSIVAGDESSDYSMSVKVYDKLVEMVNDGLDDKGKPVLDAEQFLIDYKGSYPSDLHLDMIVRDRVVPTTQPPLDRHTQPVPATVRIAPAQVPPSLTLIGDWFGHYLSWVDNAAELISEEWSIKETESGVLSVQVQTLGGRGLSFRGFVEFERDQFVVKLDAVEHDEEVYCRFKLPIPGNEYVVDGMYLGIDFQGRITAGVHILSKEQLDASAAMDRFSKCFTCDQRSRRVIRML